jgi:gephyrin
MVKPLPTVTVRVDHTLRNHVLAEDILAQMDLPNTRTTNVDGYAVVVEDGELGPGVFPVKKPTAGEAGQKGFLYRINTGGPLPEGCNAVVMVEDTKVTKSAFFCSALPPASNTFAYVIAIFS